MVVNIHCKVIENKNYPDVVILRGLEFPNIIVQGTTVDDAIREFRLALGAYFRAKNKMALENNLLKNNTIKTLAMEFLNA